MSDDLVLPKLKHCKALLAECKTSEHAKQIADLAEAARIYAKRVGAAIEVINEAVVYRILAEKRFGEIERDMPKAKGTDKGGRRKLDGSRQLPSNAPLTLAERGISKQLSARSQKLADVTEEQIEEIKQIANEELRELSTAEVLRFVRGEIKPRGETAPPDEFREYDEGIKIPNMVVCPRCHFEFDAIKDGQPRASGTIQVI